jgi:hypothetical protein
MSKGNPFADLNALRTFGDGGEKEFLRCVQEMPGRPARKRKRKDFTLLQLEWAAGTAKAARTPGAMVWILLHYMEHNLSALQHALGQIRRHPLHEIPDIGEFGKGRLDQNSTPQQTSPARYIARRTKVSNIKSTRRNLSCKRTYPREMSRNRTCAVA